MRRTWLLAAALVLAAVLATAGRATNPPDARIVAGAMPGFPHALPQRYGRRALSRSQRALYTRRFARIRIGAAASATGLLGRIHKVLGYTQAGNRCDYFDGGFVLCIASGHVAAKGYETSY